jgi:large subunit ribosomal protein L18e
VHKKSIETKAAIWRKLAENLSKPKRRRIAVNLSRINRYTKAGETIVVPGKVLGTGKLNHPLKIAALQFSEQAEQKIAQAEGSCMTITELLKKHPKGSGIKIIG